MKLHFPHAMHHMQHHDKHSHPYLISLVIAVLLSLIAMSSLATIQPWLQEIVDGAMTGGAMLGDETTSVVGLLQTSETTSASSAAISK